MSNEGLDSRERLGLLCGGMALLLVALFAAYVAMGSGKGTYARFKQSHTALKSVSQDMELARLEELNERLRIKSGEELEIRLDGRDPRFDLFAYINGIIGSSELTGRAQLVNNPTTARSARGGDNAPTVKVTLSKVSLKEVVDFLYKVYETESLVVMQQCDIEPELKEEGLHCDIVFQTIKT